MRATAELGTLDWSDPQPAPASPSHGDGGGDPGWQRDATEVPPSASNNHPQKSPSPQGERPAASGREAGSRVTGGGGAPGLGLSVRPVHAGSGRMNGGAEVNGVGGGLETSPNSTGCGRLGGGGGGES